MTTRQLFQSTENADLRNFWKGVVTDPKFAQVLLYVRSAFLEVCPGAEQLEGARKYEMLMTNLDVADDPGTDMLAKVSEAARLEPVDHLLTRKTIEKKKGK